MKEGHEIGRGTEEAVQAALENLKKKKIIGGYKRTDGMGEDFQIFGFRRKPIGFEVKSSRCGARKHKKRYQTPVIFVRNRGEKMNGQMRAHMIKIAEEKIRGLIKWKWD